MIGTYFFQPLRSWLISGCPAGTKPKCRARRKPTAETRSRRVLKTHFSAPLRLGGEKILCRTAFGWRKDLDRSKVKAVKSKLLPIGVLLMVVGLLGRPPLASAVASMQPGTLRGILFPIATDGLSLCFFAGVTCALLGWLRNRKAMRLANSQKNDARQSTETKP